MNRQQPNLECKSAALVVFSGGQDSTTCLHWALNRFQTVVAVTFDYGQRHRIELEAAARIAAKLGVEHHVFPMEFYRRLGGNALVDGSKPIGAGAHGLPNTFVPGRNLLFLTCAAAMAYQRGMRDMVTGVCEADYSGYPDCRQETMDSLAQTLRLGLGLETGFHIHTPLMYLTKADTVRLAITEGALGSLALSHTCYEGVFPPCNECPACRLRAKGFLEVGIPDPLAERARAFNPTEPVRPPAEN